MELEKKNVVEMIGLIKANYTYAYKDASSNSMQMMANLWFNSLYKYDKRVVDVAFQKALETCKMPPTLADIIENIRKIKVSTEPTEMELWEQLVTAVNKADDISYYFQFTMIESNGKTQGDNARDKFNQLWEGLPQVLKDYCGNKNGLLRLTETDMSYEKGRFLKILPQILQRQEIRQTINSEVLDSVKNGLLLENKPKE